MRRHHRIPRITPFPRAELGGQLSEPGRQHGLAIRCELPGCTHLIEVPVRILQRQASLARTTQPVQDHYLRPRPSAARQPSIQLGQELLTPGQEYWPRQQRHRLPCHGVRLARHRARLVNGQVVHGPRSDPAVGRGGPR